MGCGESIRQPPLRVVKMDVFNPFPLYPRRPRVASPPERGSNRPSTDVDSVLSSSCGPPA